MTGLYLLIVPYILLFFPEKYLKYSILIIRLCTCFRVRKAFVDIQDFQ